MIKPQKKIILTILVAMVVIVSIISIKASMAYYSSNTSAVNKFLVGEVDIDVDEEWKEEDSWDGKVKDKKVKIKNKTNTDTLVRVSITPRWIKKDGTPFSGDVSSKTITLNFTENLKDKVEENYWVKGNDGYYYYMKKLVSKEETSELLSSVSIRKEVVLPQEYKNKTLTVDVKAEAVQATNYDIDGDGTNEYQYEEMWINVDQEISNVLKEILNK